MPWGTQQQGIGFSGDIAQYEAGAAVVTAKAAGTRKDGNPTKSARSQAVNSRQKLLRRFRILTRYTIRVAAQFPLHLGRIAFISCYAEIGKVL
jgi:hypothetical protein